MNSKDHVEEKECIICRKKFFRRIKARVRSKNEVGVKKVGTLGCSKECSQTYRRVEKRFRDKIRNRDK